MADAGRHSGAGERDVRQAGLGLKTLSELPSTPSVVTTGSGVGDTMGMVSINVVFRVKGQREPIRADMTVGR